MNQPTQTDPEGRLGGDEPGSELELSDEDILDAMREIPGYLDITTTDFRAIYHLAHGHALERLFRHIRAASLMLAGIEPLHPETRLDKAARMLVGQGRKSLPVVDGHGAVVGILTESDFLRRLRADSFLELLLRLLEDQGAFTHRCHETQVSDAMTRDPVTVSDDAGFRDILEAFRAHDGRSMPVVDAEGRLCGLLLRKAFIEAHHLEDLL